MSKPFNKLTNEDVKTKIVKKYNEGKDVNYVLGWLKGINEDNIFTQEGYEGLQDYIFEVYIFYIRKEKPKMLYPA